MYSYRKLPISFFNNLYLLDPFLFSTIFLLRSNFNSFLLNLSITPAGLVVHFLNDYLYFIFFFLKKHSLLRFSQLSDMSCVDLLHGVQRFLLFYYLLSISLNLRISCTVSVADYEMPYSLTFLYKAANWYERELWDMFGIFFQKNRDMRRILSDYGFVGHPLRKDFPLSGYVELFYDETKKRLFYEKIALAQEYRFFNFSNPWKYSNFQSIV